MQGNDADADADGSRLLLLCYKILLFVAVVNCKNPNELLRSSITNCMPEKASKNIFSVCLSV